jgi:hypothetical protein
VRFFQSPFKRLNIHKDNPVHAVDMMKQTIAGSAADFDKATLNDISGPQL